MTQRTSPLAQLTSLEDLSVNERAAVEELIAGVDFDALAAAAGMTRAQLDAIPALSGMRGRFRTPYPLMAAVHGGGHGGGRAHSRGKILTRLGFIVNPTSGIDKNNYRRLDAAAQFYGIALPQLSKDGPAVGSSTRDDDETFTAAWELASTQVELCDLLGMSTAGVTNARNRARAVELGLPDKFSADAVAARSRSLGHYPEVPSWLRQQCRETVRARKAEERARAVEAKHAERAAIRAQGCPQCDGPMPSTTQGGNPARAEYCSDLCRHQNLKERRRADNLAAKAAAQGPCEHCSTPIEAGAKHQRFCTKSCSKKFNYAARRASR